MWWPASNVWSPNVGAPAYARFDHGPEFIACAVAALVPLELLNGQRFDLLLQAHVLLKDWGSPTTSTGRTQNSQQILLPQTPT
jgi:hypothetical protein